MARKRSSRKKGKKPARTAPSYGRSFLGKPVLGILIIVALLGGAVYGMRYFFLNSDFFTIREISVNKDRDYSFRKGEKKLENIYLGRNIFSVDPRQVRTIVQDDYPQLKKVEVRRNFPGVLEVDIVSRRPAAVIDSGGGIIIDSEAVVLAVGERSDDLVKIKGISFFLNAPSRGEKIDNRALETAMLLLDAFRERMGPYMEKIEYLDISDRNNIVVNIYGAEVKMGQEDFARKIYQLKNIMNDSNINMKDIKYIDLRFEDAIIAPK